MPMPTCVDRNGLVRSRYVEVSETMPKLDFEQTNRQWPQRQRDRRRQQEPGEMLRGSQLCSEGGGGKDKPAAAMTAQG